MKLCQFLLKLLTPASERQRMECRHLLSRANAEAEDLTRTMSAKADDIRAAIERSRRQKVSQVGE